MDVLSYVASEFKIVASKPELFLEVQNKKAEQTKSILKKLYDWVKEEENGVWLPKEALPELVVEELDEEQIWQEIDLQNEGINNGIVKDVAHLLSKKERLAFELGPNEKAENEESLGSSGDEENDTSEDENDEPFLSNDDDDDDDDSEEEDISEPDESSEKSKFTSELDDDFFKLCDMENFCDKMEKDEPKTSGMDLFNDAAESDEERELWRYNDFFTKDKKADKDSKPSKVSKGVRFAEENFSDEDFPEEGKVDKSDDEKEMEEENSGVGKSSFEARQERLKKKIAGLEDAAMDEKPWFLKGEITSSARPQNSLLQEYVEFDRAVRPAPVFTEKTTLRLEDIIKQRVKDKVWDDVVRKVKPVEDVREYRQRLVLDQEKSKVSLAEIYEQEYIKQRDAAASANAPATGTLTAPTEQAEPPEHQEIRNMMKKLFTKLDALSNFHYTPKPVEPEIKIISNLPAIAMEDVAPVSASDATLLAPEEIKNKPRGELMSKEERTATDKNRERRKKKTKQRIKEREKKKKDKLINKLSLGLGNKYSKETAKRTLDKLTKEGNVDRMVETQSKHLKSSSAFFSKLSDEVKTQVSKKGSSLKTKRKKLDGNITAKKLKL